ncbi:MAG: TfoX/Sxy family protein [Cyclobacteriaceae bacterium]|nr:TfoX/Sxy family protein [Cyclobacteriaceae bacterium HetDA_MAG_MS6]
MAYDENLAERLREQLLGYVNHIQEKKMFGGLCFLYNGKMCVGIVKDELMARVVSEKFSSILEEPYVREMDFTKKPLKNFIYVEKGGFRTDPQLKKWIELGIEHAKEASKS